MPIWLAVTLGGAFGTLGRYGVGVWARALWPAFPAATLIVNVLGGLVMGLLASYAAARPEWSGAWRLGLMTGVLGGFTTFSAFSLETLVLWREGALGLALVNVALNVILSLLACALGLLLGRSL
ncbi:MAG: fluoride efflux transporter CrcB [Stagnimonas sp.]|nr:fluoride efflux transporter CrcB [Stagnimonas sp.]